MQPSAMDVGLVFIALTVLIAPVAVKKIGDNLEIFLFLMGFLSAIFAGVWSRQLVVEMIAEPIAKGIVPAVLIASLLLFYGRPHIKKLIAFLLDRTSLYAVAFLTIVILGSASSIITTIIASLILVEIVGCLPLARKSQIDLVVVACFSIGLGAVLFPLGEPLSTVVITELQAPPYNAGFFFLFDMLGKYILTGILAMGVVGLIFIRRSKESAEGEHLKAACIQETPKDVGVRVLKVYIFVMAMLLLASSMKILIDRYLMHMSPKILYWLNICSAIFDNATLAAAEIDASLSSYQITAALMGLLIAGGMLVTGSIANIISANGLGVTSREWARHGVPLGLATMVIYYVWIFMMG